VGQVFWFPVLPYATLCLLKEVHTELLPQGPWTPGMQGCQDVACQDPLARRAWLGQAGKSVVYAESDRPRFGSCLCLVTLCCPNLGAMTRRPHMWV
jgi:hypothetical protein